MLVRLLLRNFLQQHVDQIFAVDARCQSGVPTASEESCSKPTARRSIEAAITTRLAERQRYQVNFGVLFIDIDDFKSVNDRHGHDKGDHVLRLVAKTLTRSLRPFDLAGRWGGEEFLALILNVDLLQLSVVAERVRALIAQTRIPLEDNYLNVTVSIGGTLARPDDTPETLVNRADRFMYQSKMAGRNRIQLDDD